MLVCFPVLQAATSALLPCTAGFDTSAAALAFTVYHISCTTRVEREVLAEVDAFGRAAIPTYDDLDQVRCIRFPSICHPAAQLLQEGTRHGAFWDAAGMSGATGSWEPTLRCCGTPGSP